MSYMAFCDLHLHFKRIEQPEDYHRTLSLNRAVASVQFRSHGITLTREAFISYPDSVLVVHLAAESEPDRTAGSRIIAGSK